MSVIHQISQHIFSSVERGFFPQSGRGFQTVAVSPELIGTDDLRVLEEAAFYAISRERLAAGDFPVKETFFRLPSGGYAVGRTKYLGTDALGREGNYVTRHFIFPSLAELRLFAADVPTALVKLCAAAPDADLTPHELAPLTWVEDRTWQRTPAYERVNPELLADFITAVDAGERAVLLIGDELMAERLLAGLFSALAVQEWERATFSTHFYGPEHLRPFFAIVAVGTRAEAPSPLSQFVVFDLNDDARPSVAAAQCLRRLAGRMFAGGEVGGTRCTRRRAQSITRRRAWGVAWDVAGFKVGLRGPVGTGGREVRPGYRRRRRAHAESVAARGTPA